MVSCSILGCQNRTDVHIGPFTKHITFHSFPKDPNLIEQWISATGRQNWCPSKYTRICSKHFEEHCFRKTKKCTFLRSGSLPKLFINDRERREVVETQKGKGRVSVTDDHTYATREEPPAFIRPHVTSTAPTQPILPYPDNRPKIMTIGPAYGPSVNVIHVGDGPQVTQSPQRADSAMNKPIRRSEQVLRQAADYVSRGFTFQTVSEEFNIPVSTLRFFMVRKGILPQRRRGCTTLVGNLKGPVPKLPLQYTPRERNLIIKLKQKSKQVAMLRSKNWRLQKKNVELINTIEQLKSKILLNRENVDPLL